MLYDTHSHSLNSDGRNTVDEMCLAAIEKGLTSLTVTDHSNLNDYVEKGTEDKLLRSIADIRDAQEKYKGKLDVFCGIELGEHWYSHELAKRAVSLTDFDFVLCSVHYVPNDLWNVPYHKIKFNETGTDEELSEFIGLYFDLLSKSIDGCDFDSLAHISCPVRYMTGRHKRQTNVMVYEDKIREILKKVIDKGAALEYNTCCLSERYDYFDSQHREIFAIYKELGGELITIGSDAHTVDNVGNGFELAMNELKSLGFGSYYYYKNRRPVAVKL